MCTGCCPQPTQKLPHSSEEGRHVHWPMSRNEPELIKTLGMALASIGFSCLYGNGVTDLSG